MKLNAVNYGTSEIRQ